MFLLRGRMKNARAGEAQAPVLRGNMHRAIVLKAPDENFSEAVFILRDNFPQGEGVSRKELLRQAMQAVSPYCEGRRRPGPELGPAVLFMLGAATAVIALWTLGLF